MEKYLADWLLIPREYMINNTNKLWNNEFAQNGVAQMRESKITFALNCAKYCFFAPKWFATKAKLWNGYELTDIILNEKSEGF